MVPQIAQWMGYVQIVSPHKYDEADFAMAEQASVAAFESIDLEEEDLASFSEFAATAV